MPETSAKASYSGVGDLHGMQGVSGSNPLGSTSIYKSFELLRNLLVQDITLMKIDFEGAEIIVLQGLKETINNKMPLFSITYSDFKSNVREYAAFLNEVFAGWN